MPYPIRPLLNRRAGRSGARRRSRFGSVLILVVALLVLMALIGTAWISTTRTDRYSTQQHAANTEIDLLVDGAVNMIKAVLADDLFGPPVTAGGPEAYRPSPTSLNGIPNQTSKEYEHFDAPRPTSNGVVTDSYLAERDPVRLANNMPGWGAISGPLVPAPSAGTAQYLFEDVQSGKRFSSRTNMEVTFITVGGRKYPALIDRSANSVTPNLTFLAADADGDGMADSALVRLPVGQVNGITYYVAVRIVDNNSGINVNTAFSRDNEFDGANSPSRFAGGNAFHSHTFFPSRVGLMEMLQSYRPNSNRYSLFSQEMTALNRYRWNGQPNSTSGPRGIQGGPANSAPVSDSMELRNDFRFMSMGEALWEMLGNRLDNPGVAGATGGANPSRIRYRALGLSDAGAVAYANGVVVNPQVSPTVLETALATTIGATAGFPSQRFEPDMINGTGNWFPMFDPATTTYQIRHLLVTRNAVSNAAPWHEMPEPPSGTAPRPGDLMPGVVQTLTPLVLQRLPAGQIPQGMSPEEAINLHRHLYPMLMPSNQQPGQQPGTSAQAFVSKASINTAEFGELWRAFWMVMHQRPVPPPPGTPPPPPLPTTGVPLTAVNAMFRSPLRDPNVTTVGSVSTAGSGMPTLPPCDTMLLRSALAAVNAIDLRDSDNDITTQRVFLSGGREALVYGTERQPFITEVYANTDRNPNSAAAGSGADANPRGYVAVELYNPYSEPLVLSGYTLAVCVRAGAPLTPPPVPPPVPPTTVYPSNTLRVISGFAGIPAGTTMPPNTYLLLENFTAPGDTASIQSATVRPAAAFGTAGAYTGPRVSVPNLDEVIEDPAPLVGAPRPGGELLLLRTRRADGTPTTGNDPFNPNRVLYAESLASPETLVPVDSFDFSGLRQSTISNMPPIGPPGPPVANTAIHYVRGNDPGTQAWKFVYPGRWDPTHPWEADTSYHFRQEGTHRAIWAPLSAGVIPPPLSETDPMLTTGGGGGGPGTSTGGGFTTPITLGTANAASGYVNDFPAIQLCNSGWAGPSNLVTPAPHSFPFGTFARNGDMLQVPFFGAYRIKTAAMTIGSNVVEEFQSVTADCAKADDNDTYAPPTGGGAPVLNPRRDDQYEMLGRFCPISSAAGPNPTPPLPATSIVSSYDWAADLFDYLTVQAPHDDYLPNVFPPDYNTLNAQGTVAAGIEPQPSPVMNADGQHLPEVVWGRVQTSSGTNITAMAGLPGPPDIQPTEYNQKFIIVLHNDGTTGVARIRNVRFVPNGTSGRRAVITFTNIGAAGSLFPPIQNGRITAQQTAFKILGGTTAERTLGVEGLVNINTAPRRVLEALPIVVQPGTGRVDVARNTQVVDAIINRRQTTPFVSPFDLNQLVSQTGASNTFQNGMNSFNPTATDANAGLGDYSPATGSDGVIGDFEQRFLMMNRLSNLVTTRSDTFTCYVLVQGWRGVGSTNPELVVQRRRAFIADRTGVTPTARDVTTQNFYNE